MGLAVKKFLDFQLVAFEEDCVAVGFWLPAMLLEQHNFAGAEGCHAVLVVLDCWIGMCCPCGVGLRSSCSGFSSLSNRVRCKLTKSVNSLIELGLCLGGVLETNELDGKEKAIGESREDGLGISGVLASWLCQMGSEKTQKIWLAVGMS
jgi:hypothetical protein